jgi:hypothetical protein
MATGQVQLSLLPKPSAYNDTSQPFLPHLKKGELFLGQYCNGHSCQDFFRTAEAMHIRNVADNTTLHHMDRNRLNFPSVTIINRMIQVADIVNKENPWASATSCPEINRFTAPQELDQHSKDILALAEDIRAHSRHHTKADFQVTVKFEDDRMPTDEAFATIRMYFADYSTFDVHDLRSLKNIQEMSSENYHQTSTKLTAYLTTTYTAVPRLSTYNDVLSMLIVIHENHNGIRSQYNIQGTIQQCIRNFGVHNNDSPVDFASELHVLLHNAHKLKTNH